MPRPVFFFQSKARSLERAKVPSVESLRTRIRRGKAEEMQRGWLVDSKNVQVARLTYSWYSWMLANRSRWFFTTLEVYSFHPVIKDIQYHPKTNGDNGDIYQCCRHLTWTSYVGPCIPFGTQGVSLTNAQRLGVISTHFKKGRSRVLLSLFFS